MNKIKKACFMGLGYIGLPTATVTANNGIEVIGVDTNPQVVNTINQGDIHIVEPDLKQMVAEVVEKGLLKASLKPEISDAYFIVVPTPFKDNHEPDISFVVSATQQLIPILKKGDLFIIESTCPVHTTEKISQLIYKERPELENNLHIAYCPERVLPGNVVSELIHNDRVIGGIDNISTEKAKDFYQTFVKGQLHSTNARTAEMCKLTENASRDVQIAFANELSIICDKADINVWELIHLANQHPRVNILQPGCGVGGHCIAVDPWFIVSKYPAESNIIKQARKVNNYKALWCSEKIHNSILEFQLKHNRAPQVALMGLAFKPNIDDLRESPAKYIVQKVMQSENNANIMIAEPNIEEHKVFKLTNYKEAFEKADIVAYLVAHKEFTNLPQSSEKVILDFCGISNNF